MFPSHYFAPVYFAPVYFPDELNFGPIVIYPTPLERIYFVPAETRMFAVYSENRVYIIPA
jgi:hypothetical protein